MAALLLAMPAVGAAQKYSFKSYAYAEGLSNINSNQLMQDRSGFLWIGTQNGLHRYDGQQFTSYGLQDGLPSTDVQSLHEDRGGIFWVGTRNGVVVRTGSQFKTVYLGEPVEMVGYDHIASHGLRTVYLSTSKGVARVSGESGGYRAEWVYRGETHGLEVEPEGRLWFGCGTDLCRLEGWKVKKHGDSLGLPAQNWSSLARDGKGNLWLRSPTMLYRVSSGGWAEDASEGLAGTAYPARPLTITADGELMVPTQKGLAVRAEGRWKYIGSKQGLPRDAASHVFQDREGSLWIAITGEGVVRWLGYQEWENWTTESGLSFPVVWAVRRDGAGQLWVGTDHGLNRMTGKGEGGVHLALRDVKARALAVDPDGHLWAGLAPGGLARFQPGGKPAGRFGKESGLLTDSVYGLMLDREQRLWISTIGGLYRSSPVDGPFHVERLEVPGTDLAERFYQAVQDAEGAVWIPATRGLVRWREGQWRRFGVQEGLKSQRSSSVTTANDGRIWVAYAEPLGISAIRLLNGKLQVEHHGTQTGLSSDKTYFLGRDKSGNIWAGTERGLNAWNGRAWRQFGTADGLLWDDCNSNGFFQDSDGAIWISTSRGLSRYTPSGKRLQPGGPPVELVSVSLGGKQRNPAGTVEVPYAERSLHLRFAALSFRNEKKVSYRYRLSGVDDTWIESQQSELRYPNLAPGEYLFEVFGISAEGVESANPTRLRFRVRPPFWLTWWFLLMVVSGCAGLVGAVWKWRLKRLEHHRRELEQLVEARTQQLSLEKRRAEEASRLKTEFLTNISHEIRTPMNGILGMTDLALEGELNGEQRGYLEASKHSAQSLLTLLNELLDFSKIEAGRLELRPQPFTVRECGESAVRSVAALAQVKKLQLRLEFAPDLPEQVVGDEARIRQVLLNLLGNAVKFTETGWVVVRMSAGANPAGGLRLKLEVEDTGIGIPEDQQRIIFEAFRQVDGSTTRLHGGTGLGLAISKQLVEMMGGEIQVASREGEGSRFRCEIEVQPCPETEAAIAGVSKAAPGQTAKKLRILIAEDNPVNQLVARRMLERQGHLVVLACSGAESIDLYQKGEFDLVLMDVQMPGMDGLEATRVIRGIQNRTGRFTPVLALTAHAGPDYRDKCLEAGMDGYLSKPIDVGAMTEAIQSAALLNRSRD